MPPRYSRDPDIDQDISWRTEELGPELRRALFEKAMRKPSASSADQPDARKARKRTERPSSGSKKEAR